MKRPTRPILAFVLVAAAAGFSAPRSSAATVSSPTVFREGGHPLRLSWTARVREGEVGSFTLYRRQVGRQVRVAEIPAQPGRQTYRIEDRGNLDASADYELRWRSVAGEETVVGELRCERDSACNPSTPMPQRHAPFLESPASDDRAVQLTCHEHLGGATEARPLQGFVSTAHAPPRRGS